MKKIKFFVFVISALTIVGCTGYNKVLKSDDYTSKFEMANELYDDGQELRSIALYEQVYQRMPKTGEGELAYFRIGKGYYLAGDYYMAGYYLGQFHQRFSMSKQAEQALFLSAMCSVKNSPEFSLDQNETDLAINDLQQFIDKFPASTLLDSCNSIIDGLRFKLEQKEFNVVKLYSKTANYRAATSAALTFMADYPMSQFNEDVSYLLVLNSYLLSKNSVEIKKKERIDQTIERYRTFVASFPDSDNIGLVTGYYKEMELEKLKDQK
ncbi:MAG: outer membrane protein assembly factor BamD [Crocinitomicaceae bacterium]|nr:outer membrane protein assembly factor BamD [Crocinitomicaceae bacterium]MDG1777359.1 outer membrane protein assembly factor BamD [Crocinitomicaceae bacterium]